MLFPKYKSSIFDFKGLRCLRIDQKSKGENAAKMFKNNPDILVLLLHGFGSLPLSVFIPNQHFLHSERENAGLNITCASRVFLLESVVHHGFELQGGEWYQGFFSHLTIILKRSRVLIAWDNPARRKVCSPFLSRSSILRGFLVYCYYAEGK